MKTLTLEILRSYHPCYDLSRHLPAGYSGNILDIIDNEQIPFEDRLWVILRTDLVSEKLMRLFAVWSYRQTLKFISNPDPRSVECAVVAENFANGLATEAELLAAESAAESAARSAASLSAWSAWSITARSSAASAASARSAWSARSTAELAARSAALSASRSAAESAAWSATARSAGPIADSAADSAAWSASWSALRSSSRSAASAASAAARSAQTEKLKEMIIAGIKTGDVK